MNRLLKISSITGSAVVPIARRSGSGDAAQHQVIVRRDLGLPARFHDGGGVGSAMMAGLDDRRCAWLARTGWSAPFAAVYIGTTARHQADMRRGAGSTASGGASDLPTASTETASTISARAGIRKE
jgi:hypothetical protein